MDNDFTSKVSSSFWGLLENNKKRIRHLLGTDIIADQLSMLMEIYMPAMVQHQKVFPKYKGIHKGKTVVITGTGPTFDYYKPLADAIHIGVNNAIYREDIHYDYILVADYDKNDALFEKIFSVGYDLIKFFGVNYRRKGALIPEYLREKDGVETFYVDSYNNDGLYGPKYEKSRKFIYPLDISVSPLKSYGTSMYCAFQIALWTHPSKIYIVGADCYGKGHAKGGNYTTGSNVIDLDYRSFIRPWRKAKEWAEVCYPDIKIFCLNPVGLKGIFIDEYTDEYRNSIS